MSNCLIVWTQVNPGNLVGVSGVEMPMNAPGRSESLRVACFAATVQPGQDGVSRVLYRLIDAMKRRGVDSVFFSPSIPPADERPVPMYRVPSIAFPLYRQYRFALPGYGSFEQILRAYRPDILHIHSPCSLGMAAVQFGERFGVPVVATYHTHFASYAKYYRVKILEGCGWNYLKGLYNCCQRTFVPSLPIMAELDQRGIRHLEFLPHGTDTRTFHPRFRSARWREEMSAGGKSILLYAGRLVWEKDLHTLIGVYDMLGSRRKDWVLVIAGDGPVRRDLEAAMPDARFAGFLSGRDLSIAYASSDVFVFPSATETFGNVMLEAMASGLVPVCASEGGACGVVEEGVTGFVTRPRDPADIASRIEFLLDHPGRRLEMARSALAAARTRTWGAIFARLFAAYAEVIGSFQSGCHGSQKMVAA